MGSAFLFKFWINTVCLSISFPLTLSFWPLKNKTVDWDCGRWHFLISQKSLIRPIEKQKERKNLVLKWGFVSVCVLKWGVCCQLQGTTLQRSLGRWEGEVGYLLPCPFPHLHVWVRSEPGWTPASFFPHPGPWRWHQCKWMKEKLMWNKDSEAIPDLDSF